ncbi:MAG: NAD(P)/FAD-dependent oxidoreductase, partial [Planctomycetes bacterium]|nr:NAD(P)/FAD-dependent oxidoreductase [Planctomycetota bacterium]
MTRHHSILIVGGGSAGISVAARLRNADASLDIAIVEPSDKHYYQPIWTLVGGGVFAKEVSERDEADYIPKGTTWIRERATGFEPERKLVHASGGEIGYDQLVVCAGIQLDWHKIKGLDGHLGKDGICSNYTYETVEST